MMGVMKKRSGDMLRRHASGALAGASHHRMFQYSSAALLVAFPMAIFQPVSSLAMPVDFVLALAMPYHGYMGLKNVVLDYVPRSVQNITNKGLAGLAAVSALGLLRLTFEGPGISSTVKSLWLK